MSEPAAVLICALASQQVSVSGTIRGKHCAECGAEVQIAPAGQAMLANHPDMAIWCILCAVSNRSRIDKVGWAPGAIAEALEFLRKRNVN